MYWPSPEDSVVDVKDSVMTGKFSQSCTSFLEQLITVAQLDEDQQLFAPRGGPSSEPLNLNDGREAPPCGQQPPANVASTDCERSARTSHLRHQKMWCRHLQYPR